MTKKDLDWYFKILKYQTFIDWYEIRGDKRDKKQTFYEFVFNSYKGATHFVKINFVDLNKMTSSDFLNWIRAICNK